MSYFINTWRTPKHGHFREVEKLAQESLKATGRFGNLSVTVSHPRPTDSNLKVIGTVGGFQTADDVGDFFNSIWENESGFNNIEKINALCEQSNVSVSKVLNPSPIRAQDMEPRFIYRHFITPVKGAFSELSKMLVEWNQDTNLRVHSVVSHDMSGPATRIRVSQFVETLGVLEELQAEIWSNQRMARFSELVSGPPVRGLGRITLINRPE